MKVPSRHVEENVYLERTSERSNPVLPKRQAAAPPRSAKMAHMGKALKQQPHPEEFYIDPNTKKPPEVDRKEKPGKKSIPKKFASPPPPAEEVIGSRELEGEAAKGRTDFGSDQRDTPVDSDDLYLEPQRLVPLFLVDSSSPDIRRSMFPGKLAPPTLGIKSPLPASLKEPKPIPPPPPVIHSTAAVSPPGMKTTMQEKEWFAGNCNRKTAEDFLLQINKDGAFLIRHSSAQNARQPYTLAVLYRQKVYNIPICFPEETRGYALGKAGKKNEEFFCSLQEIISHHKLQGLFWNTITHTHTPTEILSVID
uniref:SH2 domain-containing protein n=1 Tax=Oncorhynchus mykiss TaxID=8022 RepID=A0A8C7M195_ONCMY